MHLAILCQSELFLTIKRSLESESVLELDRIKLIFGQQILEIYFPASVTFGIFFNFRRLPNSNIAINSFFEMYNYHHTDQLFGISRRDCAHLYPLRIAPKIQNWLIAHRLFLSGQRR